MSNYVHDWNPLRGGYWEPMRKELRARHNAMLADQAAEAINDFRVALAYLSKHPFPFAENITSEGSSSIYQRLIRGLR